MVVSHLESAKPCSNHLVTFQDDCQSCRFARIVDTFCADVSGTHVSVLSAAVREEHVFSNCNAYIRKLSKRMHVRHIFSKVAQHTRFTDVPGQEHSVLARDRFPLRPYMYIEYF